MSVSRTLVLLAHCSFALPAVSAAQAIAPAPRAVGHPPRIGTLAPVVDARTFAVARSGDRALIAYVQSNDPHDRGALRTVVVRALPGQHAIERVGHDAVVAPAAYSIGLYWDGTRGALVYTVPRPHRGEVPGTHRQRPGSTARALADVRGSSALTAADIVLQPLDAQGAPVGRSVVVFEENARAYRVAVAPDRDGWRVAWTGSLSWDGEIQGTVRHAHVDAHGIAASFASETGFTGQVGDVLRIVEAPVAGGDARVVFAGERCVTREGEPPRAAVATDPSEAAGVRPGEQRFQHPDEERPGPPIACGEWHLYAAEMHADGTTSPLAEGPEVATDAFAHVDGPTPVLIAPVEGSNGAALARVEITHDTVFASVRVLVPVPRACAVCGAGDSAAPEVLPSTVITPSLVPPPAAPDARHVAAYPRLVDATRAGDATAIAALSATRSRVAYASAPRNSDAAMVLFDPAQRIVEIALVAAGGSDPWLFALTGEAGTGTLIYADTTSSELHATTAETAWAGDERFRQHLLRARAARAAFNAEENIFGPLAERADVATNARMPGIVSELRRLLSRWEAACEPLTERARWLARHGVDASVMELAREQCETPPEPVVPTAPIPPGP